MGVHHPNSKGHTEAWESISPTQNAKLKLRSPSAKLKGLGNNYPNSRGNTEAWESSIPTQKASEMEGGIMNQFSKHPKVTDNWPGFLNSTERLKAHN